MFVREAMSIYTYMSEKRSNLKQKDMIITQGIANAASHDALFIISYYNSV